MRQTNSPFALARAQRVDAGVTKRAIDERLQGHGVIDGVVGDEETTWYQARHDRVAIFQFVLSRSHGTGDGVKHVILSHVTTLGNRPTARTRDLRRLACLRASRHDRQSLASQVRVRALAAGHREHQ